MQDGTWLDFINSTGHSDPTDYIVDALAGNPDALNSGNMSEILYVVGNSQCVPILASLYAYMLVMVGSSQYIASAR